MNSRIFPDISNDTERFQAHQVASAGAPAISILCTDGLGFVSPAYASQAADAHDARIPVWHYHFCRPERNRLAIGEAVHFWRHARTRFEHGDRLVLDVERAHPEGPAGLVRYVHRLDAMLHEISGIEQCAYMPDSLFRQCGSELQTRSNEFWIASWGGTVARLGHGRKMVAQQISNGREGSEPFVYPGIGHCDTNRMQRWYLRQLRRERAVRERAARKAKIAA
jgi:GH25 family lysozyme M1 (1,4-beta-N-acetylmuramidase)